MKPHLNPRAGHLALLACTLIALSALAPTTSITLSQAGTDTGTFGIAWSPDGQRLAAANSEGELHVLDSVGNQQFSIDAVEGKLIAVEWDSDGKYLATGGDGEQIRIWDANSTELLHELTVSYNGVFVLAWQPNDDLLLAAGFDWFQAWDTDSWEPVTRALSVSLLNIRWSPDGSRFAFAGTPRHVGVATLTNGVLNVTSFLGHTSYPLSVAWNANSDQLVSAGGRDGSVRLWDANTGEQLALLLQTDQKVTDAIFVNPSGSQVVAITEEGDAYLINVRTGRVQEHRTLPASLWRAAWNPQADLLAISGQPNVGDATAAAFSVEGTGLGFLSITPMNEGLP